MVTDLLQRWPDLQHLQRCHDGTLRTFLRQHHWAMKTPLASASRQSVPPFRRPMIRPCWRVVRPRPAISPVSSPHCAIRSSSWNAAAMSSSPIIPTPPSSLPFPVPASPPYPDFIAAFGTRRERYQSAFEVECDSGIAPVHVHSGKFDRVSMRHACQDFTRQTFHEFAGQSIPQCPWAKAFYQEKCHKPAATPRCGKGTWHSSGLTYYAAGKTASPTTNSSI